ncbi:nitrogen regulation protein NR(II) [Thiobaca trueperi]|uniref:Sensory histidine kinase/phosphatase NtrB n=1 Tax=Thiobaca trueperi TaxID=127458 RepID=A0A4R3N2S0_9GAMM|nr:nitrogen regulation protein NR(II) [Thiobaca trueperi]TCT22256.1 two-component system nitrogen regulation sensor histidine kinase GlnL [Thiobaca trueperi]
MTNQPAGKPAIERTILDHLNTAVMLFDKDLYLRYINPAAEVLFEVSSRHLVGLHAAHLLPCPDTQVEQRLAEALSSRHPFTEREINVSVGDGRTKTVNCTVLPLNHFDSDQEVLVELYQVDRQLRITREEHLLSQHQATQALIRGLAHEIKNPLGGLRGAAQLLEQELPDPGLREYTRIIIDEADRLQALVNRMIGSNRLPRREPVNIHDILEHVRGLILAEFPRGPEVLRDYDPSIPDVMADADRLIQAFLNLARNAAAAAGVYGHLELRTRVLRQFTIGHRRHRLVLQAQVRDNGPGIPEEIRNQIFFPMVSGHPSGTGLGLPIAQELISQHGGLIECDSRPGDTAFFVYLPLETAHDERA